MKDNRCQFIKIQSITYCESYGCTRRAAWAIGRPDGPQVKRHNLCTECARDLVEGMPEDLLVHLLNPPVADSPPDAEPAPPFPPVGNELGNANSPSSDNYSDEPAPDSLFGPTRKEETGFDGKIFPCTACGEVFYDKYSRDKHRRTCTGPVKKKGGRKK